MALRDPASPIVLIVDDNRDGADSLARLLRLSGYTAHTAYSGQSAFALLDGLQPDVVLLDLGMPGWDGIETARRILEQPPWRKLPLVALTGWGNEEDRQRTRDAGFAAHLVKPVQIDQLQALLQRLLGSQDEAPGQ